MPILSLTISVALMAEHGRATDSGTSLLASEIAIDVIAWLGPLPFQGMEFEHLAGEGPLR